MSSPPDIPSGDLVLYKRQTAREVGKLDLKWEDPFKVLQRLNSSAYYLEDVQGKVLPRP